MTVPLGRRLFAELLGSAFLAAVVIGSGIAAQHLSPGDVGLELFENAAATAAGLFAIILMFGPVSGAHFNPVVSLVDASFGGLSLREALAYAPAQIIGCILGFTSSTSFANPAISIGRMFSNTFAGIAPASVPGFVLAQLAGGAVAIAVIRVLYPDLTPEDAAEVVLPHGDGRDGAPERLPAPATPAP
jgi:glycerol uptake facilitator-like aquaporin